MNHAGHDSRQCPRTLDQLPPEIISQIISHAPSANFLANLSLANHSLRDVINADGWTAFVTMRFPSISTPPYWSEAAHTLTTLSRNFDRKAFIAQDAGPDFGPRRTRINILPGGAVSDKWERRSAQTMGYQPVIDSIEVWTGRSWSSRREIVSWGAGAEAVIKIEERDGNKKLDFDLNTQDRGIHRTWLIYRDPQFREGIHDITALRILEHTGSSRRNEPSVKLVIGRASGGMQMVRLSKQRSSVDRIYECGNANVQCADINDSPDPFLAACLGDSDIGLYKVRGTGQIAHQISAAKCGSAEDKGSRFWSSRFISQNRLAVGRGVSKRIVHVYEVRPDGINEEPVRAFSSELQDQGPRSTSAYPIVSVPKSAQSNDGDGNLLFSGGYDGIIRLHDMRSSRDCVGTISDNIDNSAIFSLVTVGRERIVAGAAAHGLLKVFDLRMPGGRAYSYMNASTNNDVNVSDCNNNTGKGEPALQASGANIYTPRTGPGHRMRNRRWGQDSPVYSLSRPSPSSCRLYVGLENSVLDFNFTSATDPHPDPIFARSLVYDKSGRFDSGRTWNRDQQIMALSMYEQSGPTEAKLVYQKSIPVGRDGEVLRGYDERWHVVNNMRAPAVLGDDSSFSSHRFR